MDRYHKHVIGIYVPCSCYGRGVDRDIDKVRVRSVWALTVYRWVMYSAWVMCVESLG